MSALKSGEISAWLGYKAISLHHLGTVGTSFQDNQVVIDWVNDQPLARAKSLVLVMDMMEERNIINQLAPDVQRKHKCLIGSIRKGNRPNVGGELKRLKQAQALLWLMSS